MVDFAEEPPELQMPIDVVLEYNMRQVEIKLTDVKGEGQIVYFGDDLGMQDRLPISPHKWQVSQVLLRQNLQAISRGWLLRLHTHRRAYPGDHPGLDCGVNVINPQVRANGLDNLADVCKGKVCVDLDLDRQMFPFCEPADIDAHVREAVEIPRLLGLFYPGKTCLPKKTGTS